MFITRKEHSEVWNKVTDIVLAQEKRIKLLEEKIDSLAKELGYEWTSEAVKESELYRHSTNIKGIFFEEPREKAVLKWGWKKIEDDDFTEEWERQVEKKKPTAEQQLLVDKFVEKWLGEHKDMMDDAQKLISLAVRFEMLWGIPVRMVVEDFSSDSPKRNEEDL